jgi:hypothetical protein
LARKLVILIVSHGFLKENAGITMKLITPHNRVLHEKLEFTGTFKK